MNDEEKKVTTEQVAETVPESQLSEQELNQSAGGASNQGWGKWETNFKG